MLFDVVSGVFVGASCALLLLLGKIVHDEMRAIRQISRIVKREWIY